MANGTFNLRRGRGVFAISLCLPGGEGESQWQSSDPVSKWFLVRARSPNEACHTPAGVTNRVPLQTNTILDPLGRQLGFLLLLGLPIACLSWTVTHEEIFREPRQFCKDKSESCRPLYLRKLFYLFTCEYCFSHYVTAFFLTVTQFQLLYRGWRGYLVAEFALVWVANVYMGVFNRLRLDIKSENILIQEQAKSVEAPRPVGLIR